MIISRTPFRISLVGGGTDLRQFYTNEAGAVLSTSIDKYLYVVVRRQIGLVEHPFRVAYSAVEFRDRIDDIEHPIVREALRLHNIDFPVEITTFADIPAYTGLGSSSAFAVGLLHALHALLGRHVTKAELAAEAAHLEMDVLGRHVGKQDHYASAYGGLNTLTFHQDESVAVEPVFCGQDVRRRLQQYLMLFYTGLKRDAAGVLEQQSLTAKRETLRRMRDQVAELRGVLSAGDVAAVGRILHEGWVLKRSTSDAISCQRIDQWYEAARTAGAIGGKVCGSGGGGFLLLFVPLEKQIDVSLALHDLYRVPFAFDSGGSRITYFDHDCV